MLIGLKLHFNHIQWAVGFSIFRKKYPINTKGELFDFYRSKFIISNRFRAIR
mgnify:CR=1 FL=1